MLDRKSKIKSLIDFILKSYVYKNKILPLDGLNGPFKKIFEFTYTYGYDINGVEYYFIIRNEEGQGFMFFKYSYKENGSYKTETKVVATEDFLKVKSIFEGLFDLDKLRKLVIERMYSDESFKYSFERVLSNIVFYNYFKRPIKAKVIGLIAFSYCFDLKMFDLEVKRNKDNINDDVANYIVSNIEKLAKKRIDFSTIN